LGVPLGIEIERDGTITIDAQKIDEEPLKFSDLHPRQDHDAASVVALDPGGWPGSSMLRRSGRGRRLALGVAPARRSWEQYPILIWAVAAGCSLRSSRGFQLRPISRLHFLNCNRGRFVPTISVKLWSYSLPTPANAEPCRFAAKEDDAGSPLCFLLATKVTPLRSELVAAYDSHR
jgi:hypothetical protein